MHKLLPFRQYDEKDVINLFSLDVSGEASSKYTKLSPDNLGVSNGGNWSGTLVVPQSDSTKLGGDEPTRTYDSYLGKIGSQNQGNFTYQQGVFYPSAPMQVSIGSVDVSTLGLTLRPTIAWDENDEKLLYYPVKKDEFQAVLPGEAVPVATRGFFTVTVGIAASGAAIADANGLGAGTTIVPGSSLKAGANGKFVARGSSGTAIARILATGQNAGKDVALIQLV
jgi:hypothetical protein